MTHLNKHARLLCLLTLTVTATAHIAGAQGVTGKALDFEATGSKVWSGVCLDSPSVEDTYSQVFSAAAFPASLLGAAQCAANDGNLSMILRHRYNVGMVGDWNVSWTAYVIGDADGVGGGPVSGLWATQPPEPFSLENFDTEAAGSSDDEYPVTQGVDVASIVVSYSTTRSAQCIGDSTDNFSAQDFLNNTTTSQGGVYLQWPSSYTGTSCLVDADEDDVENRFDNCTQVANPDQRDTDGDGYGNLCDADFDNNDFVGLFDLVAFRQAYFTTEEDIDLNGDGIVNLEDLVIFKELYFRPPGPSGLVD